MRPAANDVPYKCRRSFYQHLILLVSLLSLHPLKLDIHDHIDALEKALTIMMDPATKAMANRSIRTIRTVSLSSTYVREAGTLSPPIRTLLCYIYAN